jgi:CHRD domain
MKISTVILAAATFAMFAGASAVAEVLTYKADLNGASETPSTASTATGTADVKVDTAAKTITWVIKYSGLTGNATAAHFHGPAAVGEKAGPEIDISKMIEGGTAPLTDAQLADIQAGKVYVNIHSAKFPDGEIRGQVVK